MTRQNKFIILIVYLMILAIALPVYRIKRAAVNKRLKAQISAIGNENTKSASAAAEMERLRRLFPSEPGSALFIESLYSLAHQSKLVSHDVKTENTASTSESRTASRTPDSKSDSVKNHLFKISVEGSFRNISEYIRRVQNLERFKRITEIKLVPGKHGVSGNISIELFSLKDKHAR